jgi:dTMP kinase
VSKGRFITLEGGEGAGKSTQAIRLIAYLTKRGVKAIATREVGGALGAEDIRSLWLSKPEGFWILSPSHADHGSAARAYRPPILPALESGTWVISDRLWILPAPIRRRHESRRR